MILAVLDYSIPQGDPTAIAALTVEDVGAVYAGKDGACCCGCSGTHFYASAFREEGGKRRGYSVDDRAVNDTMVARVLGIIQCSPDAEINDSYASVVVNTRLYIAYFRTPRIPRVAPDPRD